ALQSHPYIKKAARTLGASQVTDGAVGPPTRNVAARLPPGDSCLPPGPARPHLPPALGRRAGQSGAGSRGRGRVRQCSTLRPAHGLLQGSPTARGPCSSGRGHSFWSQTGVRWGGMIWPWSTASSLGSVCLSFPTFINEA
uniref:Uncharacterized protein n=1 Tax=Mustela putorius furo TaxID=9669 RepID=M3YSR6_MUSPF